MLCNFIKIALQHGCSPVNLLQTFRTPLTKNTSEGLLLVSCFGVLFRDVTRVSSYESNPVPHNPFYYYSCLEASFANILKRSNFTLVAKYQMTNSNFQKLMEKFTMDLLNCKIFFFVSKCRFVNKPHRFLYKKVTLTEITKKRWVKKHMKLHEFFHDGGPYSSPNQWTGC